MRGVTTLNPDRRRNHPNRPAALFFACCALFAGACDSALVSDPVEICHLRVAWDPYEPYSYTGGGGAPAGYDIDVVTEVAGTIDCELSFTELAWNDVLLALQSGDADIAVGTGYKADRSEWSWYSESYRREVIGLMVRAGTSEQFRGDSFASVLQSGLTFGMTTDDTYDASMTAAFEAFQGQVRPRADEPTNIHRLLDDTIDGFLVEVNVGAAIALKLNAADQIEFHPLAFDAGAYRFQMSKVTISTERLAEINAAIQELDAAGWLASRLDAYGIPERNRVGQ